MVVLIPLLLRMSSGLTAVLDFVYQLVVLEVDVYVNFLSFLFNQCVFFSSLNFMKSRGCKRKQE